MPHPQTKNPAFAFLQGGGKMGERMRAFDWARTPVGSPESWPLTLKSAVSTLLECRLPMYLAWGPALTQFYNDAYLPILGDKHEAALGESTLVTWHEIWPTIGPMWQEVLQGRPVGFDDFKLTIDRFGYPEDCFFNFSYSPVRDDAGGVAGVLVTFAETTQRVKSERRLKFLDELGQATRRLTDATEVMRVTSGLLGSHLGVNRCGYAQVHADEDTFDVLGDYTHDADTIVGRFRFSDFGQPLRDAMRQGRAFVENDVETGLAAVEPVLDVYRRIGVRSLVAVPLHKDGRLVAAMAVHRSEPHRWREDEVELVHTVVDRCWEALERVRAERVLREQASSLEILHRTGAALSAELDLDALLQRVTDAATTLTGARFGAFFYNGTDSQGEAYLLYTLSGAPRSAFEKFGHPRPTALFGPTFRGGAPIRLDDVRADPRYGQWGPHHGMPKGHLPVRSYLAVPVMSRTGEVIGGLFFGHPDVGVFDERSEALAVGIAGHAAIAVDNARLFAQTQAAARERAALLESERAARMEAQRASSLKDEFLATLSHELRTPLSAILGWVHILRRKLPAESAELRKGIEVIERSTRIQVQLIDDLLDMSRITSGKLRLDKRAVLPAQLVQAAADVVRPSAQAAGVELSCAIDAVPPVWGDPGRLQQVVWNLLANAVKFTPRGGRVDLRLQADGGNARIEVRDTGAGIRPDMLTQIFERFRQADGSITRRFGGLGLGLSIVRHLVEVHGGAIEASSEGEGRGARFTVTLPLMQDAPQDADPASKASVSPDADLTGVRILVIDDETDARELLARVLEDMGAKVVTRGDAESGIAAVEAERPDLLVSDISMPGMDGYEVIRRVRRTSAGSSLPAVALTAFARPEDREKALQAGFDAHVAKPMEPALLVRAVSGLLRRDAAAGG
ncbi:GAF domain-containing protein [Ramlibacter albus]|uniref:Virulence sensor protein BvgS n=1 Tax=Ramlibacter albus TaxID=2079448 RepID=A0A923MFN0_9BURK|nr:GAF domain-containing protein [Ramlibacter albus]MBC5768579.1 GAF domain-containing protein [Ramlibacter albus]